MRDLRKKALLQSGKTQSRRAKARGEREDPQSSSELEASTKSPGTSPRGSPLSSRAGSRNNSRPGSRYASSDESEGDYHTKTPEYASSFDSDFDDEDIEASIEDTGPVARLRQRIPQLQNFRARNASQRETALASYLHIIRSYDVMNVILESFDGILASLLNSIRRGASEKEILTAVNALSVTIVACPDEPAFDRVSRSLKMVCEESESEKVKVAAMNALAVALAFGGGGEPECQEISEFLLEIVESDGQSVGAEDNGVVVTGALQAWGCVAGYLKNLAEYTEDGRAMEAFLDQLESTDVDVQVCAGYNIAQLFEAARNQQKRTGRDPGLQHSQHLALSRMSEIVRNWTKATSKKDRRLLRQEFPSIIVSIEQGVGPGYIDSRGSKRKGGRLMHPKDCWEFGPVRPTPAKEEPHRIRDNNFLFDEPTPGGIPDPNDISRQEGLEKRERPNRGGAFCGRYDDVETWTCHARLMVLKQVLASGIQLYWEESPAVFAALEAPAPSEQDENDSDEDAGEEEDDGDDEDDSNQRR